MGELLQVLEHLITSGPARNPGELGRLLGLLEQARERFAQAEQPAPPAPGPAPVTVPVGYPPSSTNVNAPGGSL